MEWKQIVTAMLAGGLCFSLVHWITPKKMNFEGLLTEGRVRFTAHFAIFSALAAMILKNPTYALETGAKLWALLAEGHVFEFFANVSLLYFACFFVSFLFVVAPLGILTFLYFALTGKLEEE